MDPKPATPPATKPEPAMTLPPPAPVVQPTEVKITIQRPTDAEPVEVPSPFSTGWTPDRAMAYARLVNATGQAVKGTVIVVTITSN